MVNNLKYKLEPCDFYLQDADQDGYGLDSDTLRLADPDPNTGYTTLVGGDCDDSDGMVNPGETEIECNGKDDDAIRIHRIICPLLPHALMLQFS